MQRLRAIFKPADLDNNLYFSSFSDRCAALWGLHQQGRQAALPSQVSCPIQALTRFYDYQSEQLLWCWAPLSVQHQNLCEHFIWNFQYSDQDHFQQFMSHSVWILGYWWGLGYHIGVAVKCCDHISFSPLHLLCSAIVTISHKLYHSYKTGGEGCISEIRCYGFVQKYSRQFFRRCCYEKALN